MNANDRNQKFGVELNDLVNDGLKSGVPLNFMVERLAAAEFELRTVMLEQARVNQAVAQASAIVPANGVIQLDRGRS